MPASSAFAVGSSNAFASTSATAMPSTPAVIAVFIAVTIWETFEDSDPVHCGVGIPSSAAASARPYWVAWKNVFVVTWLTKVNLNLGVLGKSPGPPPVGFVEAFVVQAASAAADSAAMPDRPAPRSKSRRVIGVVATIDGQMFQDHHTTS